MNRKENLEDDDGWHQRAIYSRRPYVIIHDSFKPHEEKKRVVAKERGGRLTPKMRHATFSSLLYRPTRHYTRSFNAKNKKMFYPNVTAMQQYGHTMTSITTHETPPSPPYR